MIAPWIPVTVVPTSFATVAIETFITEASSIIKNRAAASAARQASKGLHRAVGQRGLEAGGPVRRALGRKYLAGLAPGYWRAAGLRGKVHGWPREKVNAWRQAYVRARAAAGVAGLAEFDFRFENNQALGDARRPWRAGSGSLARAGQAEEPMLR